EFRRVLFRSSSASRDIIHAESQFTWTIVQILRHTTRYPTFASATQQLSCPPSAAFPLTHHHRRTRDSHLDHRLAGHGRRGGARRPAHHVADQAHPVGS